MRKYKGFAYAVLGIAFVLFSILAFIIPTEKTLTFWIAYAFSVISFGVQIAVWKVALYKAETLKSKFFAFPVINIGIIYLLFQLIACAIFIAIPSLQAWVAVVVCILILGIAAICLSVTEAGKNETIRVEQKVQKEVLFIRELQSKIELMADQEVNLETKEALNKLAEYLRYSDPMSGEQLIEIESMISAKAMELNQTDDKMRVIREMDLLIAERNKKCKYYKEEI